MSVPTRRRGRPTVLPVGWVAAMVRRLPEFGQLNTFAVDIRRLGGAYLSRPSCANAGVAHSTPPTLSYAA
jgi:hypothetical protein